MDLTCCTMRDPLRGWMRKTKAQAEETKKEQNFHRHLEVLVLEVKALLTIFSSGVGIYRDAVLISRAETRRNIVRKIVRNQRFEQIHNSVIHTKNFCRNRLLMKMATKPPLIVSTESLSLQYQCVLYTMIDITHWLIPCPNPATIDTSRGLSPSGQPRSPIIPMMNNFWFLSWAPSPMPPNTNTPLTVEEIRNFHIIRMLSEDIFYFHKELLSLSVTQQSTLHNARTNRPGN